MVLHQCFVGRNISVSHHLYLKAPHEVSWPRTLCEKPAGRNRKVWTGLASRLSLRCLKANCEQLQQCFQVTYTSETLNCVHTWHLQAMRRGGVYIITCTAYRHLQRSRYFKHHTILKFIGTFSGTTLSLKESWVRKRDLMKPTMNTYAWVNLAELESALVIAFERCSFTTCYLTSCRCWAKAALNCTHSYSAYFFFQQQAEPRRSRNENQESTVNLKT